MDKRMNRNGMSPLGVVIYVLVVFLVASFQIGFFGKVNFFGAVPSLLLALTAAAAFFDGANTGAAVGCGAGLCADSIGSFGVKFSALVYALIGFFIGAVFGERAKTKPSSMLADWSLTLLITVIVGEIVTILNMVLSLGKFEFGKAILYIILPEAIGTYIFGFLAFPIYLLVYKNRFSEKYKQ